MWGKKSRENKKDPKQEKHDDGRKKSASIEPRLWNILLSLFHTGPRPSVSEVSSLPSSVGDRSVRIKTLYLLFSFLFSSSSFLFRFLLHAVWDGSFPSAHSPFMFWAARREKSGSCCQLLILGSRDYRHPVFLIHSQVTQFTIEFNKTGQLLL